MRRQIRELRKEIREIRGNEQGKDAKPDVDKKKDASLIEPNGGVKYVSQIQLRLGPQGNYNRPRNYGGMDMEIMGTVVMEGIDPKILIRNWAITVIGAIVPTPAITTTIDTADDLYYYGGNSVGMVTGPNQEFRLPLTWRLCTN